MPSIECVTENSQIENCGPGCCSPVYDCSPDDKDDSDSSDGVQE